MFGSRPIRRTRRGDFEVRLGEQERQLLTNLVPQLRTLLDAGSDDPSLRRLFPTAYPEDAERDEEYQALVRDDLVDRRRRSLEVLESTAGATRLGEEELLAWMAAVNDLRLVLGTTLDVSEETSYDVDPDDPDAPALAVYGYLGFLLEHIVEALGR